MTEAPQNNPGNDGHPTPAIAGKAAGRSIWCLVPCAGRGERVGGGQPKQYQLVAGRPVVMVTLAALTAVTRVRHTLVLLAPSDGRFAGLAGGVGGRWSSAACGGATRAATVLAGLPALRDLGADDDDWVLVHDAARCLVTPELVDRLIDACADDDVGGLLAEPVPDTLKLADSERVAVTLDRRRHWLAQTPQMFRLGVLQRALEAAGDAATDEASAIEALGLAPRLVHATTANFKVTYVEDLLLAQAVLTARHKPVPTRKERDYDYP